MTDKSSFVYMPYAHRSQQKVVLAIPIDTKSEPPQKQERQTWEDNNVVMRNKVWMMFTLKQGAKS